MPTYKLRNCEVCGAEFVPAHFSQITCSPECQRKRKRLRDRDLRRKRTAIVADIKVENEKLKAKVAELEACRVKAGKPERPKMGMDFGTSDFEYCERMRLKMARLPCGEHQDCWRKPECDKTRGLDWERCLRAMEAKAKIKSIREISPMTDLHYTPINSLDMI